MYGKNQTIKITDKLLYFSLFTQMEPAPAPVEEPAATVTPERPETPEQQQPAVVKEEEEAMEQEEPAPVIQEDTVHTVSQASSDTFCFCSSYKFEIVQSGPVSL